MKNNGLALEATYWYILLEKVENDKKNMPAMKKLLRQYIQKELVKIKKEIERNGEKNDN